MINELINNFGFFVTVGGMIVVPAILIWYVFEYEYKPLSDNEFNHQMAVNAKREGAKKARLEKRAKA